MYFVVLGTAIVKSSLLKEKKNYVTRSKPFVDVVVSLFVNKFANRYI